MPAGILLVVSTMLGNTPGRSRCMPMYTRSRISKSNLPMYRTVPIIINIIMRRNKFLSGYHVIQHMVVM